MSPPVPPRRRRWLRRALLFLAVLVPVIGVGLTTGCAITDRPADPRYTGPAPLPPAWAARFAYEPMAFTSRFAVRETHADYELVDVDLDLPEPVDGKTKSLYGLWYRTRRAKEARPPTVLVLPILAGHYEVGRMAARSLAAAGLHAFLPFRDAASLGEEDGPARRPQEIDELLVTTTVRLRRLIDWLSARPEVDPARMGVLGVSMGALRATVLLAVEPRIRSGVIIMGGGPLASVLADSGEGLVARWRDRVLPDRSEEEIRTDLQRWIAVDPMNLAGHVDARRVLLIMTRFDHVIRYHHQKALRRALGRPAAHVVPSGHYGLLLWSGPVLLRATRFLATRLATGH